jgi:hypothetical protein
MGGVSAASSSMTSSFLAIDENEREVMNGISHIRIPDGDALDEHNHGRPERMRQKRSVVVDDLVWQMRTSALTQQS